ncbi:MAG: hypothetical protein JRI34_01185 [Deltaproteobacteria bacterium]|nr:hypothetical protein [Deltaproteobacteria bacterium]MBW2090724.1 hypothetical protein [Deltaproteobacteria bacterium]
MKILYVEDELSKNIPRLIRLFSRYLGKKAIKNLKRSEADETGYGAKPEEIKKIVEKTGLIEIEYRFPDALRKIVQNHERYALFVIDRNLSEMEYEYDELKLIDAAYSEDQYDKFFEREGDYLLHMLVYRGVNVLMKFYFLTAYPAPDEIRGVNDIQTFVDFGKFHEQNFVEKADNEQLERLKSIIENIKILNLKEENKQYFNILQKKINEETAERFLKVLDKKDEEGSIEHNLLDTRKIYEAILGACSQKIPDMNSNCTDKYGDVITGKETIDWLSNNKHINSIHRNFFFSIKAICSDFGGHNKNPSEYQPTLNTINSIIYSMKDVILWFGEICNRYPDSSLGE